MVAVATGVLINARLVVFSASLSQRWRGQPRWFVFAAALVIGPTWAAVERRADDGASDQAQRQYFLAAGVALGIGWSALIAVGIAVGGRLDGAGLEVAVPLCLAALIGPPLRPAGNRAPVIAAAGVAVMTAGWPAGTGLLGPAASPGAVVGAPTDAGVDR